MRIFSWCEKGTNKRDSINHKNLLRDDVLFWGGGVKKIPTTNLRTYLETWCNPHDSWINQICYLFQFGFDLYRYPSTTTKTWKISSETASLRVSASCRVTSFRCCGSRATVILRQKSISPINIAMIHQIVLIILVVTIASCELAFPIPTNGIEYCMYHLLWAATGNLKGDVVVSGTCKSLSSFNLLALSSSHRRAGNPSSAPFMNDDRSLEPAFSLQENGTKWPL